MSGNVPGARTAEALATNPQTTRLEHLAIQLDRQGRAILSDSAIGRRLLDAGGLQLGE